MQSPALSLMRWIAVITICLFAGSHTVRAAPVLQEDFNDSAYEGSVVVGPGGNAFSEAWANTLYYEVNAAHGWSFGTGAYYAKNDVGNGAVLLNEGTLNAPASATQPLATKILTGLTKGQLYVVSFLYWGDNNPGLPYVLNEYIDGALVGTVTRIEGGAGSEPAGFEAQFQFTATDRNVTLGFGQASVTPASAIIDDVSVAPAAPVPEPVSLALLASGFAALLATRLKPSRQAE